MKNKKIISRVLAIFAVLVLMVSMALPAFADEGIESNLASWEQFYFTYSPNYGNLAFEEMYADNFHGEIIQNFTDLYLFSFHPNFEITNFYGNLIAYFGSQNQFDGTFYVGAGYGEVVVVQDGFSSLYTFYELEVNLGTDDYLDISFYNEIGDMLLWVTYDYNPAAFSLVLDEIGDGYQSFTGVNSIEVAFGVTEYLTFSDDIVRTLTNDDFARLSPRSFYDGMYLSNRPDGVVPPSRTGMFGQIYYILYDAIYGSDAVIGTSQDFVLTQIATWMTYIVILLPLLVVAIFLWRVFAR